MRYYHLGIPTTSRRPGETYLPKYKAFCTDHEGNPFGIQWMRFEPDCPLPDLVKTVPHVAFQVDDLERALEGHEILIQPNSPSGASWWRSWCATGLRWSSWSSRARNAIPDVGGRCRDHGQAPAANLDPPSRGRARVRRGVRRPRAPPPTARILHCRAVARWSAGGGLVVLGMTLLGLAIRHLSLRRAFGAEIYAPLPSPSW